TAESDAQVTGEVHASARQQRQATVTWPEISLRKRRRGSVIRCAHRRQPEPAQCPAAAGFWRTASTHHRLGSDCLRRHRRHLH
uniref:Clade I nitrous oxide reductase n=1 Tax=Macrostomum lignano TaxID=282301 RepID=A0A1I8FLS1_9PLAT